MSKLVSQEMERLKYPILCNKNAEKGFQTRQFVTAGDKFVVLTEWEMEETIMKHWRRWLPEMPLPRTKPLEKGLTGDATVITVCPLECIPHHRHFNAPDIHRKLQLKSAIPKIGVPCPRHMSREDATFPCFGKPDQGWYGIGHHLLKSKEELDRVIEELENTWWKDGYIIQEFIPNVTEVPSYNFYLDRSGSVFWVGMNTGLFKNQFEWYSSQMDWNDQERRRLEIQDDFIVPIMRFLSSEGYFGLVNFEAIQTPRGKKLVDLNLRVCADTPHIILSHYMAKYGFFKSRFWALSQFTFCSQELIEKADKINAQEEGRVIILAAEDKRQGCQADVSIFGTSYLQVQDMFTKLSGNASISR